MAKTTNYILQGGTGTQTYIDLGLQVGNLSVVGQRFKITGSDGDNSFFLRPAGYAFDFTDNRDGADAIYLTGERADYTASYGVDPDTGADIVILTRGSGDTSEEVIVSRDASGMTLSFADGALAANAIQEGVGGEVLDTDNKSVDFTPPDASSGEVRVGSVGTENQANLFGLRGQSFTAIGNGGVDKVFVAAGATVDATSLGVGEDEIYLEGSWASYEKTVSNFQITLTREVVNPVTAEVSNEEVKVIGGIGASNDRLFFADGSIRTRDMLREIRKELDKPDPDPNFDITGADVWDSSATSFSSKTDLEGVGNLTLALDTGDVADDRVTSDGTVNVTGLAPGFAWRYSTDGGNTWLEGTGSSFTLDGQAAGEETGRAYDIGQVQVIQINPFGVVSEAVSNDDIIVVDNVALEPNYTMDEFGLELTGSGDGNEVSANVTGHGASLTVQYWVYFDAADLGSPGVHQQLALGPTEARLDGSDIQLWDGSAYQPSLVSVSAGWNFISLSRHDGAFNVVVVNEANSEGVFGGIPRSDLTPGDSQVSIGQNAQPEARLSGVIRDLRIWDADRNQSTVVDDSTGDLTGDESGLIAHWRLDGRFGEPVNQVDTGPTLTLGGDVNVGADVEGYPGGNVRFHTSVAPLISGDAAPFADVQVFYTPSGGEEIEAGTVEADAAGHWQFPFPSDPPLAAGEYAIRVEQTDVAGNTAESLTTIVVAAETPAAPVLQDGSDSGELGDNLTNVARPVLEGKLPTGTPAGTRIAIMQGDVELAFATDDQSLPLGMTLDYTTGDWSYELQSDLADDVYEFSIKVGDGPSAVRSEVLSVEIDRTVEAPVIDPQPPAVIQEATFAEGDLRLSGKLAADIASIAVRWVDGDAGTAEEFGTVSINPSVDPDTGEPITIWEAVFTEAQMRGLTDGEAVRFGLIVTDKAGNVSTETLSDPVTVEFVNTAPEATPAAATIPPQILLAGTEASSEPVKILDLKDLDDGGPTPDDAAFTDADPSGTDNGTLTYSATWNGGVLPEWLTITDDGVIQIVANATVPVLDEPVTLVVRATDGAEAFAETDIVIDALAAPDLDAASDSGASDTDNLTNVAAPTFTGRLPVGTDAGTPVSIFIGITQVAFPATSTGATPVNGVIVDYVTGAWSYTPESDLAEDTYNVALEVDGVRSLNLELQIDTTPVDAPVVTDPPAIIQDSNVDPETGLELTGTMAADVAVLTVRWKAGDGADGPSVEASLDNPAPGQWKVSFSKDQMLGMPDSEAVEFSLVAQDAAGNETVVESGPLTLELVNEAPEENLSQSVDVRPLTIGTAAGSEPIMIVDLADINNDGKAEPNDQDTAFTDADPSDTDNGTLTYTATWNGGDMPPWLRITSEGVVEIVENQTVPDLDGGFGTLTVTVEDGRGATASRDITISTTPVPVLTSVVHGETSVDVRSDVVLEAAGEAIKFNTTGGPYAFTLVQLPNDAEKAGFNGEDGDGSQTITVTVTAEGATFDGGEIRLEDGKAIVDFDDDFDLSNRFEIHVDAGLFVTETGDIPLGAVETGDIRFATVTPNEDPGGAAATYWEGLESREIRWFDGTSGNFEGNVDGLDVDVSAFESVTVIGRDANLSEWIELDSVGRTKLTGFGADDYIYIDQDVGTTENRIDEDSISIGNTNGGAPTQLQFSGTITAPGVLIRFADWDETQELDESGANIVAVTFTNAALEPGEKDHTFESLTGNGAPVISG